MKVSIILVHYHKIKVLDDCIKSIYVSKPNSTFEIIVVDNDEVKTIEPSLMKHFPKIKYIKGYGNLGYGKATNLGVKNAIGEYIFNLNPDTIVEKGVVDKLIDFIQKNKKVGAVAPTLYDKNGKNYPLQGTRKLTPFRGIFALSFLNKYFPGNPISKSFWLLNADRSQYLEADTIPFTLFMMRKDLFQKMGGFDENYFLYFEEADFCNRLKAEGYKLFILPDARAMHLWGANTPKSEKINKILVQSRFYYFKKHFGILNALIVEFFARMNKWSLMLITILALGTFLRFYRFFPNFLYTGEMGTDYMNIWNIIHGSRTFLIGPRTSHEWFFISPIAYWIYTILLLVWKYNLVVISVFWGIVGSLSVLVCYATVKKIFNKNTALISSFLVATSPAWIAQTRNSRYNLVAAILFLPYLLYLRDSIKDKGKSLFKLGLILGLTMSFFPSPLLLIPASIVSFFFYGVKPKFKYILNFILGFLIPNITFLIYEVSNGFSITLQLISWVPYRILGFFGLYQKNTVDTTILSQNFYSIYHFFAESFLGYANVFTVILFFLIVGFSIFFIRRFYRNRNKEMPFFILIISLLVSYIGLFIHGNPPEHYYLVIFPVPAILAAYILDKLTKKKMILIGSTLFLGIIGIFSLTKMNWFYQDRLPVNYQIRPVPYGLQLKIISSIISDARGADYSLFRRGPEDQFENNFANNYIYLLTIRGAKIRDNARIQYTIVEGNGYLVELKGKLIFSEAETYVYHQSRKPQL